MHVKCCSFFTEDLPLWWGAESKKTFARPSLPLRTPVLALAGAGTRHCQTQRCWSGNVEHLKESWSVGRRCSCCRERERKRERMTSSDECGPGGGIYNDTSPFIAGSLKSKWWDTGASFHFSSLPWECLGSVMWANVETCAYGNNSITVGITRQSQSLPHCSLIRGKCSLFFPEECFWCRFGGTSRQLLVETLCNVSVPSSPCISR